VVDFSRVIAKPLAAKNLLKTIFFVKWGSLARGELPRGEENYKCCER
jgi:hypothetical protein